jgi:hypothetical protein
MRELDVNVYWPARSVHDCSAGMVAGGAPAALATPWLAMTVPAATPPAIVKSLLRGKIVIAHPQNYLRNIEDGSLIAIIR